MFRVALLACLLVSAAAAQTTTAITLSFSGTATSDIAGSASGTLAPFGAATLSLVGATVDNAGDSAPGTITITLANGDTLASTGTAVVGSNGDSGTMTITGGTGVFAQATGSFTFTLFADNPPLFTLTGKGTVVTGAAGGAPLPNVVCEGGAGGTLPIIFDPAPKSAAAGSVCKVIICESTGGSTLPISLPVSPLSKDASAPAGSCSAVNLDVAEVPGGATLPVLVFEGGGSTSPVLAFLACCGGTGGTLPVLTFEGGGSTLPVLTAWCNGCGTLPVIFERPNAITAPAGTPLEIATPLQSTAATYTAVAQCNGAPATCWLTVPVASGNIAASSRAAITAYLNPQGQTAGVYTGSVTVTISPKGGSPTVVNMPVTMLVNTSQPTMALSQTGVHLTSQGGVGTLSQSITVANSGPGSLTFAATATTLSGGSWLSVSPSSGTAPTQVTIRTNPAGMAPGTYFGRVDFSPSGVSNATQSVEVELTVLASTATPDATISPTGLILVAGGPAQTVQVSTPTSRGLTITTSLAFASGSGWFTAKAAGSTVTVTPNASGLGTGVYTGTLDIHIAETATDHMVTVLLVVPAKAPCIPSRQLPVVTNLEGGFQIAAGFPVPVQAQVVDDCGAPLNSGQVMAYFPRTNDPSVSLVSLGKSQWSGTWMPHTLAGGPAAVGIMASGESAFGSTGILGTVTPNTSAPLAFAGGVVNAASIVVDPIAPGSFFSIFGANLAAGLNAANAFPYLTTLGGTQVLLGGEALPLEVTTSGQINAVIPYDAVVNGFQQLIVQRNGMDSMPEMVLLSPSQPAVFTLDQSGKGAGAIVVIKPDGTQFVNGPSAPAKAGDILVIYGTGLGAVDFPVASGAAAPLTTFVRTTNTTTVTVGGKQAAVGFAGLTPGYASLYQINVTVPAGVTPGANVPVIVSAGGASSPPVTVVIQ